MADLTDGEKITRLETQMEQIGKQVDSNFRASNIRFDKIDTSIEEVKNLITDKYVNKDNFLEKVTDLKKDIDMLDGQHRKMEQSSNLWKWLSPTLAGVAGSILTGVLVFLIISYLQTH